MRIVDEQLPQSGQVMEGRRQVISQRLEAVGCSASAFGVVLPGSTNLCQTAGCLAGKDMAL
jgi:hypothetical protein